MTDNTTLNPGQGGDTVRALDRGGSKTQVMALDIGGAAGESLASKSNPVPTFPTVFNKTLRESFEVFPNSLWTVKSSGAAGDIVQIDGNALGSAYLVISKDPFDLGSEVVFESTGRFTAPLDVTFGLHLSQRTLGQEFVVEMVSDETVTSPGEVAIASIQQATNTLTITTAAPHNLVPGMRFGVYGVSDCRLNYASLVVASITSATSFTATAGPGGTIASLTVGPFTSGYIYQRSALGYASDGTSLIFESNSTTNASAYSRNDGGDATSMGGTLAGNHSLSIPSTTSIQAISSAYTYAMRPTSEYRLNLQQDRLQWQGNSVDTNSVPSNIATMSQVVPNPTKSFKIRVRARNNKGFTVPIAQIVSIAKTGTTTATVVTDRPHGLAASDFLSLYGVRDQANFPNLGSTQIASVVDATTFTIVIGSAATATSYGGLIGRVQGQQSLQGVASQVAQQATTSGNALLLNMSAQVTTFVTGDYVNLWGCRDAATGASLGVDGAYRVRNVFASSPFTVELEPLDGRTLPAVTAVNCGGAVIKRTDLRLSYVRLFDYERLRVEMLNRPSADGFGAMPVNIQAMTSSLAAGSNIIGNVHLSIPGVVADIASAAITSSGTTSAITPTGGTEYSLELFVSAVSGTNPTLDVILQESADGGVTWYDVYHFPRVTGVLSAPLRSPKIVLKGNRIRYVRNVGGTSPSFTNAINRLQGNAPSATALRRIFDRTLASTQASGAQIAAVTAPDARNVQLVINAAAIVTTPPALKLVGSDDNWATSYDLGTPLAAVANSVVQQTVNNVSAEQVRAIVTTAGNGATLNWVALRAF